MAQCTAAHTQLGGAILYCMREAGNRDCKAGDHRFAKPAEVEALSPDQTIKGMMEVIVKLRGHVGNLEVELRLAKQSNQSWEELHRVESRERLKSDGAMGWWAERAAKFEAQAEKDRKECKRLTDDCPKVHELDKKRADKYKEALERILDGHFDGDPSPTMIAVNALKSTS